MPSFSDLIDETLIALSGYTQRQDQSTYLTAAMTDTQTTMTVSDAASLSKGLVEVGDELMWVESFDRATNVATIAPYGRGFRSTQKSPHSIGDRVTISPSFPKDVIRKQINNSVSGVFPGLFGVYYTTFNFISSQNTYELPNEADEILQVTWQTTGPSQEWLPVRQYAINKNAYVGTFNTGKTISIYDGIVPGRTVHVVYSRQPEEMFLSGDDFEDVTKLPSYAKEPVVLGAAYRVAGYLDVSRLPGQTAEVDAIDQASPIGSGGTVTRALFQLYQQRLAVASARQQEDFPIRIRYGR
jgi:hypothetical protein